ncbi:MULTISPECIES: transglutaminase family protein [Variovorax]|jgi:transglutaminase-like putative cysteine protease|uniref:transglutaminase-like domain-containing protein n=1 Tax=Variovorax TaxID=34072 RepID=UPI0008C290BE|nr:MULTISPECIES: transglutaminase family protein [Variovorax]MDQ0081718.1 transglutaminase-like putative cysteine protease [Variovorax boronicumulans]SET43273.1 Transglutaminase-like enzyme, putative cysteine protease [Variovorax sp. OV084]SOD21928.1 Transglutaminase-like enzyme, putative cysteine protease [Variovorax sp. YR752]
MHISHVDAQLDYEVVAPAHMLLNIEAARSGAQAVVSEELTIEPPTEMQVFCDEGSGNRFIRFDAKPGPLKIRYKASVQRAHVVVPTDLREVPVSEVPDEVLHYMMPTRYCESDLMSRCAQQLFGDLPPGIGRVQAIVDWIHESIAYEPGSSDSTTTAREVFVERAGVCRDFAHLGITFCRALNIPARLVVGYVWFDEPPQDFHAVFEAWLGGQWVLFDPTRMAPVDRVVRVGTGRDAKDVAFCTIFGNVRMTDKKLVVRELQDESLEPSKAPPPTGALVGIEKPVPVVQVAEATG